MTRIQSVLVALSLLVGCSGGIDGTYISSAGLLQVEIKFNKNGKAEYTVSGVGLKQTVEVDYKIDDGKIKIGPIQGAVMVMVIDKDGCLEGGMAMGGKLCKKK